MDQAETFQATINEASQVSGDLVSDAAVCPVTLGDSVTPTALSSRRGRSRYAIFSAIYPPLARALVQALPRWSDDGDGLPVEFCYLPPGELQELLSLADERVKTICSYIIQVPFSLEAT